MSSFNSTLRASSFVVEDLLEPDTSKLYIDEIKPLFLQFFMITVTVQETPLIVFA